MAFTGIPHAASLTSFFLLLASFIHHVEAIPRLSVTDAAPRHRVAAAMDPEPNLPHDPNTIATCSWWWDHDGSIPCEEMADEWGITYEEFLKWNPSITPACGNFIIGRSYCVEIPDAGPPTTTTAPTVSTTAPGNGITTPTPTQSGMVTNCNKFHHVQAPASCQDVLEYNKISLADFFKWNPAVGSTCGNLWLDTYACVGVVGGTTTKATTTSRTTTAPGNGITTPTPTQSGMVTNCNKFHHVRPTTTCEGILSYNKISLADFFKWNPAVKSDCTGLWSNTYACVGVIGGGGSSPPPPTTTTTKPPSNGITTPTPTQAGMVTNCNKFHHVRPTTTCEGILNYNKISLADFFKWNPAVKKDCTGLWSDTYACVGIIGGGSPPPPTTTTTKPPSNGITTPTPTQAGMVTNCNKFHHVRPTTTCEGILSYNKISLADFFKWNPAVKKDCTGLWSDTYACVGIIGGGSSPPPPTTTTAKPPSNGITTPTPTQAGMVTNCNKFHHVRTTTTCEGILSYNKISLANFFKWNPAVKKDCTGLWSNTYACVGVIGGSPPPTTTKPPSNGITTPTPTQAGMVTNCNKFHHVRPTTTCEGILNYNGITLANFFKWNPAVKKDCTGMWANTYACVGVK